VHQNPEVNPLQFWGNFGLLILRIQVERVSWNGIASEGEVSNREAALCFDVFDRVAGCADEIESAGAEEVQGYIVHFIREATYILTLSRAGFLEHFVSLT
jgi:hypothetical protein